MEAVLNQVAGPDLILNSRGEWNMCSIMRLVLDDKVPDEGGLTVKSKMKAHSQRLGSSLLDSGGEGICDDKSSPRKEQGWLFLT